VSLILDVCHGSQILTFIHPGSWIQDLGYRIPDPEPTIATKEEGENFFVLPFFVATNITKLKIIICLNWGYRGLGAGIRYPGSGKILFRIPDTGVKKALDPGSGSTRLWNRVLFHSIATDWCLISLMQNTSGLWKRILLWQKLSMITLSSKTSSNFKHIPVEKTTTPYCELFF
jgi:hypothetical protein